MTPASPVERPARFFQSLRRPRTPIHMTDRPSRRDPQHEPLREVRKGLLRLHKALIDAERAAFEAGRGAMTSSQFLQALMEDDYFQWLRPYSQLIVEIDEALADRERPVTLHDARAFVERVATLVTPSPLGILATQRLDQLRRQEPGVLFVHSELHRGIAAALQAYPAG
jgi:hypothetical protein